MSADGKLHTLTVMNPVAPSVERTASPAPRVQGLGGKRIGLYWNMKSGGDVALQHIADVLGRRYPDSTFSLHIGDVGAMTRRVTKGAADKIAASVDALVGTTAD